MRFLFLHHMLMHSRVLSLRCSRALLLVSLCCFIDGWVLVANLGVGNSLTSFLVLVVLAGVDTQSALVTGIVTGGWTTMVALAIQVHRGNLVLPLWLMGLPGTYGGASVAPMVNKALGPQRVQLFFGVFLCISAAVLLSTALPALMASVQHTHSDPHILEPPH